MMIDRKRDEMIAAEQRRIADVAKRRAELQKEFDKISPPILEQRRIEQRMKEISTELANLSHHHSAVHAEYRRSLENALPAGMLAMLSAAKAELGQRQREPSAATIARMGELREWLDTVDEARRDESKTSADLEQLAERGKELGLTGVAKAFDDPPFARA